MNITLEDLLELAEGHARDIILEHHQSLPPQKMDRRVTNK
jgi:hypothetical protein